MPGATKGPVDLAIKGTSKAPLDKRILKGSFSRGTPNKEAQTNLTPQMHPDG